MMNNQEVEQAIATRPYPKVTKDQMEKRIKNVEHLTIGTTVTICNITLDNGYSVRGESACVDPRNFDAAIGQKLSYDDAFRKLWSLFGFMLAEDIHRNS